MEWNEWVSYAISKKRTRENSERRKKRSQPGRKYSRKANFCGNEANFLDILKYLDLEVTPDELHCCILSGVCGWLILCIFSLFCWNDNLLSAFFLHISFYALQWNVLNHILPCLSFREMNISTFKLESWMKWMRKLKMARERFIREKKNKVFIKNVFFVTIPLLCIKHCIWQRIKTRLNQSFFVFYFS